MKKMVELKVDGFLKEQIEKRLWDLIQIGIRNVEDFVNLEAHEMDVVIPDSSVYAFGDPEDPTFMLRLTIEANLFPGKLLDHRSNLCDKIITKNS